MLSLLLSKFWGYLAAAGGLILVVLGALGIAKRSGVKEEQAKETEKALQQAKGRNEIDSTVRDLPQSDLDKRLSRDQRD
jgi:hypothetical protein